MTVKDILQKSAYQTLQAQLLYNPGSLDHDTRKKLEAVNSMFQDGNMLMYQNNAVLVVKRNIQDRLTMEQIAEELHISPRHAERLKKQGIELLCKVLDCPP